MDPLAMSTTEIKSYQHQIEYGKTGTLSDTVRKIVAAGAFPEVLLLSLLKRLDAGEYLESTSLCDAIILTGSPDLYRWGQAHHVLGSWEYIRLLRDGLPVFRNEAEDILCKELFRCFRNDADPLRRGIVDAMAIGGGECSLELLETIYFELAPQLPLGRYNSILSSTSVEPISDQFMKAMETNATETFVNTVSLAKSSISSRLGPPPSADFDNGALLY